MRSPDPCHSHVANAHDVNAFSLMTMSSQRVAWLYNLIDSAYDANAVLAHVRQSNHAPIVDPRPQRKWMVAIHLAEDRTATQNDYPNLVGPNATAFANARRWREYFHGWRMSSAAPTSEGAAFAKVTAHLSFALIALTVDELIN
jgi:hypothetical protein